jgi:hypothetical protein
MSTIRAMIPRLLAVAAGALTVLAAAPAAWATSPTSVLAVTSQAQQADATFLAYAPAPAAGAGALCLVDTGVNANPDTTPGLIGSYAIDGGATTDVDPQGHGTTMAMIAGGTGKGILGAWPQLKIVSVRATNIPSPGQEPQYEFDYYWEGMELCQSYASTDHIKAIDLALASQIPPSPDQAESFATRVGDLEAENVAVVAAAGNSPGAVEMPGGEPNVFAVGADTAAPGTFSDTAVGAVCSFSADQGVTLYAPGCGLDAADPFSDQPLCCYDGTSEASAFTAAVIVALMSYDTTLSYTKAEQLLVGTANDGDLDVAAAFQADGLAEIVSEGNANIPQPASSASPTTTTGTTTRSAGTGPSASKPSAVKASYPVTVRSVGWRDGVLTIRLAGMRKHATAKVTLNFARARARHASSTRATITIRTPRPRSVVIRVLDGKTVLSATTRVDM